MIKKFKVWDQTKKEMSIGMELPMLAGYITSIYPKLGNEKYLQYVGFVDKNNKEIYEGDICKQVYEGKEMIGLMVWNSGKFQFGLEVLVEKDSGLVDDIEIKNDLPEVIGNVFENPELLDLKGK